MNSLLMLHSLAALLFPPQRTLLNPLLRMQHPFRPALPISRTLQSSRCHDSQYHSSCNQGFRSRMARESVQASHSPIQLSLSDPPHVAHPVPENRPGNEEGGTRRLEELERQSHRSGRWEGLNLVPFFLVVCIFPLQFGSPFPSLSLSNSLASDSPLPRTEARDEQLARDA